LARHEAHNFGVSSLEQAASAWGGSAPGRRTRIAKDGRNPAAN
jgi:hypothetical protein